MIYNKKSAVKKGRTFTANLQTSISDTKSESFNYSKKNTQTNDTIIDQFTNNNSDRNSASVRLSFVEPLWNNKNMLETVVSLRTTFSSSEKKQYTSDDPLAYQINDNRYKDDYTNPVQEYSNTFSNTFLSETLELNYRYTEKDYNLTLGMKAEPSQTYSYTTYGDGTTRDIENEVFNFAPNARFQYNFGRKTYARFDYRGRTDQPSINQMQPVKNNSNLMNETVGNPNLNPSFENELRLMYSSFNDKTFSSFNTMLRANISKDALVTNSVYDATGKQYSQTVNADINPYSFSGNVMFNTPVIQKRLHFNTSTSGGYSKRIGYSSKNVDIESINLESLMLGDTSITNRISANQQLSLTFTHDVVEIGIRGSVRYSNSRNNLSQNPPSTTYDWSGTGNFVLRLPYNFSISSDFSYVTRSGYSNFTQDELIWNASMDKTLFKGKGVLSLKWNDILRQQLNIRQTIGDNFIQYNSYNTLQSYLMVSFSYKLNKFAGNVITQPERGGFDPNRRGDGERRRDGGSGGYRREF